MSQKPCYILTVLSLAVPHLLHAQASPSASIVLFQNVRIFDGKAAALSAPSHVLVRANKIEKVSTEPIPTDRRADTLTINGAGRSLMPGLIDAHTHIMFATVPQMVVLSSDVGFLNVAAVKAANDMLLRGFTSIRDGGGRSSALSAALTPVWCQDRASGRRARSSHRRAVTETSACRTNFLRSRATCPSASVPGQRPLPIARMPCACGSVNSWHSVRRISS